MKRRKEQHVFEEIQQDKKGGARTTILVFMKENERGIKHNLANTNYKKSSSTFNLLAYLISDFPDFKNAEFITLNAG